MVKRADSYITQGLQHTVLQPITRYSHVTIIVNVIIIVMIIIQMRSGHPQGSRHDDGKVARVLTRWNLTGGTRELYSQVHLSLPLPARSIPHNQSFQEHHSDSKCIRRKESSWNTYRLAKC